MENLTPEEIDALADMQLKSLQVSKTPVSNFDVAIKSYVDLKYNDAVTASTQAVTDIIDSAPQNLNTLRELALSLGNNSDLASALTTQISNVNQAVLNEAMARAVDIASVQSSVGQLSSALQSESTDRSASDAELGGRINNNFYSIEQEQKDRALGDENLLNIINTNNDVQGSSLSAQISNINLNRDIDQTEYRTLISNEAFNRSNDVNELTNNLNNAVDTLSNSKMDVSPNFTSGGGEGYPKVSDGAYLYIGSNWRIYGNTMNSVKRLEFQYSADGVEFKTAVPFIRA